MKQQLQQYNEILVETNKLFNLTAHKTIDQSWKLNIEDSLLFNDEIAKFFKQGAKVADIGSGSGSPSIPLKISFPHIHMTLIESITKKAKFLQSVIEELKLKDIQVANMRCEDFSKLNKGIIDIVTARAVAPLDTLVKLAMPLLKRGGILLAYKGKNYQEEIKTAKHTMSRLGAKIIATEIKQLEEDSTRVMLVIKKS